MTIHTTVPVEKDAIEIARETLKIAQDNYRRANVKYTKIASTIEAAEKRHATAVNDLAGYKHADDDAALASAKLLLKGGELRLPEATTKVLAARDALRGEVKILEDGLGALREQLKDAYSNKKTTYTALDNAAAAVLRTDSDKLAQCCAPTATNLRSVSPLSSKRRA